MKQVWISEEAYEQIRKLAFDSRKSMGRIISEALLNGRELKP